MNHKLPTPFLVIDFPNQQGVLQRRFFTHPRRIIDTHHIEEVQAALRTVKQEVEKGAYAVGFLSYEAAPAFDPAYHVAAHPKLPLLWFGIFSSVQDIFEVPYRNEYQVSSWDPQISKEIYREHFQQIKRAISRGDTYQVNYTLRLRALFNGDDFAYYQFLRSAQQVNYSAYLNIGNYRILSLSPELFFELDGSTLTTRPMKGTSPRGHFCEEDVAQANWLQQSEKNRAENVMIVDLLRNDLSRVAEVGTVRVERLFEIERYATVHQMTSTVTAKLHAETSFIEVLSALFPSGSITGAPKISTMKLISRLEQTPREIYCGTIGLIEPNGHATFNVAIRTMFIDQQTKVAQYSVGGGITWDSSVVSEYEEALTKATLLTKEQPTFKLLETLKLEDGDYAYFERHLNRLAASARFFGIVVDLKKVRNILLEYALQYKEDARRVRLLVSQTGQIEIESFTLQKLSDAIHVVTLARRPISTKNVFLYHKTTQREVYESHRMDHPDVFDVLLWNERKELTEFTNGNVVVEIGGEKITPARSCGLLAGTFREWLIEQNMISESVITLRDLKKGTRIWLINSVREWVQVEMKF